MQDRGYKAGPLVETSFDGNISRSNATEARPLARGEVGELLSVHTELKVPSKTEHLVRHSELEPRQCSWSTTCSDLLTMDAAASGVLRAHPLVHSAIV